MGEETERDALQALRYSPPQVSLTNYITLLFAWTELKLGYDGWMPAVDAQVVIRIAGDAQLQTLDGKTIELPPFALVGPLSTTVRMVASPGYRAIGAGLTPGGLRTLFRVPASELVDRAIDLGGFFGLAGLDQVVQQAGDLRAPHHGWKVIEDLLFDRLWQVSPVNDERVLAVDRWLRSSLNPSVDRLAEILDLSPRQTARFTATSHGLSPKLLAIRRGAQSAAEHFALAAPDERDLAYLGYSDQSHMIRDFRRFIGTTPARFINAEDVARHAFAGPKTVGATLI